MGSSKAAAPAPTPDPAKQAVDISNARNQIDPQEAQRSYQILSNQDYGLLPTTQLFEDVRRQVFPNENNIRMQLAQNILGNLASPTGISPEQQQALDSRRQLAQGNLVEAYRNRANLGGNLYGGRSQQDEIRAVGELQNQFAEEDIGREERARLNSIQAALPFLQILFPDVGLTPPQFQSAVQSPDTYASSLVSQRGQDAQIAQSNAANQSALYQSMFGALGQGAGSAFGAGGTFGKAAAVGCWVAAEVFGGWDHPKTIMARFFVNNRAPKWFKAIYLKHGERIAGFIKNKSLLKIAIRPVFELFVALERKAMA